MMRAFAMVVLALAVASCGDGDGTPAGVMTRAGGAPDATGTPALQRISVPAGGTLDVQGAGMFFVDPAGGTIEGWYRTGTGAGSALASFSLYSISDDGALAVIGCGDASGPLCLLDTRSGDLRALAGFIDVALSPDGSMLLGMTERGLGLATVDTFVVTPVAPLQRAPVVPAQFAVWSPDSASIALAYHGEEPALLLFDVATHQTTLLQLDVVADSAIWSPDGSKLAVMTSLFDDAPDASMYVFTNRAPVAAWSRSSPGPTVNPRWSPDSRLIAAQLASGEGGGASSSVDVFDGASGETRFRIGGAIACANNMWTSDGGQLVVLGYRSSGNVLADLATASLRDLGTHVLPSPASVGSGINFDGNDFHTVDFASGGTQILARTTVQPAWDFLHEPLFLRDGRIVATFPHLGHGGCLEGTAPDAPPELRFETAPFPG